MIKRFGQFTKEMNSTNLKMMLEGYLTATGSFMDNIEKLSKYDGIVGELAEAIYDFIEDEVEIEDDEIKQNFFDTTEEEGMVSFLMNSKLPKKWERDIDPSLPYNTKGRTDVKVSKIIKYIIKLMKDLKMIKHINPKDKDIEALVNAYKSLTDTKKEFKFKLVKGSDIAKYYDGDKYMTSSGTLGKSCMSSEDADTFDIYIENEDKVQLLILINDEEDKISGRALVWKLKESPCSATYFMDRVYTNRDSDFYKFKTFAEENGYLYKYIMNSHMDDNVKFRYNNSSIKGEIKVEINGKHNSYPFIDTLVFMNEEKTELSNIPHKGCYMLQSLWGNLDKCDICEGELFVDDEYCHNCAGGLDELD